MNKLYNGVTEEKWQERLYRAWHSSATPTDTLWLIIEPLLCENEQLKAEKLSLEKENEVMLSGLRKYHPRYKHSG